MEGILGKTYLADLLNVKSKDENKLLKITDSKIQLDFGVAQDVELLCEITHKSMNTETLKKAVTKSVSEISVHTSLIFQRRENMVSTFTPDTRMTPVGFTMSTPPWRTMIHRSRNLVLLLTKLPLLWSKHGRMN